MTGYIYRIISPSKKIYIGQTINFDKRIKTYRRLKCMSQPRIYNSFIKHGFDNHSIKIIDDCDISILNERERFWQNHYDVLGDNGLNCILTKSSEYKLIRSNETREKISKAKKGIKLSKEAIEKLSLRRIGYKHSEETKSKISESNIGKTLGRKYPDHINKKKGSKKENHPLYGIGHSDEAKKKMSLSKKGSKRSKEAIDKFKISMKGKFIDGYNPRAKYVLNLETGIYYESITEAKKYSNNNISIHMLYKMLLGECKNKTSLIKLT